MKQLYVPILISGLVNRAAFSLIIIIGYSAELSHYPRVLLVEQVSAKGDNH